MRAGQARPARGAGPGGGGAAQPAGEAPRGHAGQTLALRSPRPHALPGRPLRGGAQGLQTPRRAPSFWPDGVGSATPGPCWVRCCLSFSVACTRRCETTASAPPEHRSSTPHFWPSPETQKSLRPPLRDLQPRHVPSSALKWDSPPPPRRGGDLVPDKAQPLTSPGLGCCRSRQKQLWGTGGQPLGSQDRAETCTKSCRLQTTASRTPLGPPLEPG